MPRHSSPNQTKHKIRILKVHPFGLMDLNKMTKYSDNHFRSFNGILIYGWLLFSVYIVSISSNLRAIIFVLTLMFGFIYGFLGLQLHYFYLDKNHLVVKNHV